MSVIGVLWIFQISACGVIGDGYVSSYGIKSTDGWKARQVVQNKIQEGIMMGGIANVSDDVLDAAIQFNNYIMTDDSASFLQHIFKTDSNISPVSILKDFLHYADENNPVYDGAITLCRFFLNDNRNDSKIRKNIRSFENFQKDGKLGSFLLHAPSNLSNLDDLLQTDNDSEGESSEMFHELRKNPKNIDHLLNKMLEIIKKSVFDMKDLTLEYNVNPSIAGKINDIYSLYRSSPRSLLNDKEVFKTVVDSVYNTVVDLYHKKERRKSNDYNIRNRFDSEDDPENYQKLRDDRISEDIPARVGLGEFQFTNETSQNALPPEIEDDKSEHIHDRSKGEEDWHENDESHPNSDLLDRRVVVSNSTKSNGTDQKPTNAPRPEGTLKKQTDLDDIPPEQNKTKMNRRSNDLGDIRNENKRSEQEMDNLEEQIQTILDEKHQNKFTLRDPKSYLEKVSDSLQRVLIETVDAVFVISDDLSSSDDDGEAYGETNEFVKQIIGLSYKLIQNLIDFGRQIMDIYEELESMKRAIKSSFSSLDYPNLNETPEANLNQDENTTEPPMDFSETFIRKGQTVEENYTDGTVTEHINLGQTRGKILSQVNNPKDAAYNPQGDVSLVNNSENILQIIDQEDVTQTNSPMHTTQMSNWEDLQMYNQMNGIQTNNHEDVTTVNNDEQINQNDVTRADVTQLNHPDDDPKLNTEGGNQSDAAQLENNTQLNGQESLTQLTQQETTTQLNQQENITQVDNQNDMKHVDVTQQNNPTDADQQPNPTATTVQVALTTVENNQADIAQQNTTQNLSTEPNQSNQSIVENSHVNTEQIVLTTIPIRDPLGSETNLTNPSTTNHPFGTFLPPDVNNRSEDVHTRMLPENNTGKTENTTRLSVNNILLSVLNLRRRLETWLPEALLVPGPWRRNPNKMKPNTNGSHNGNFTENNNKGSDEIQLGPSGSQLNETPIDLHRKENSSQLLQTTNVTQVVTKIVHDGNHLDSKSTTVKPVKKKHGSHHGGHHHRGHHHGRKHHGRKHKHHEIIPDKYDIDAERIYRENPNRRKHNDVVEIHDNDKDSATEERRRNSNFRKRRYHKNGHEDDRRERDDYRRRGRPHRRKHGKRGRYHPRHRKHMHKIIKRHRTEQIEY